METYKYFRLEGLPFPPLSPYGVVYSGATFLEGIATLEAGLLNHLSGLTMLTGEAGVGKTTLIYSFLQREYERVRIAHIDDPKLSFLEIMQLVLKQLKLECAGTTKLDYLNVLDRYLDEHGKQERNAIVVDNAQVLSDDVLEELRLLSNRGQRNDRCLQLILVGRSELAERLREHKFRPLNQRISTRGILKPLSKGEALTYVECKLMAQGSKTTTIFEPRALDLLVRYSEGIPATINMLCHNAMQAAVYALESKVSVGTAKKVTEEYRDAAAGTELRPVGGVPPWTWSFRWLRKWNRTPGRRGGQIAYPALPTAAAGGAARRREN
jgi:general secretion pathway protein A